MRFPMVRIGPDTPSSALRLYTWSGNLGANSLEERSFRLVSFYWNGLFVSIVPVALVLLHYILAYTYNGKKIRTDQFDSLQAISDLH